MSGIGTDEAAERPAEVNISLSILLNKEIISPLTYYPSTCSPKRYITYSIIYQVAMNDLRTIDAGSFKSVYDQFHARIFRYFLKRSTVHETATELTQQLFIKLWQGRHTLSNQHSLEVQLFTMANSVWIDHLRKQATNRKYFSTVAEFGPLESTQTMSPQIEAGNYFRLAMDKLPPIRKKVFILKMLHGFSNHEIAGKLSVSVKTVEDHLWKAMRFIRTMITTMWSIFPVMLLLS